MRMMSLIWNSETKKKNIKRRDIRTKTPIAELAANNLVLVSMFTFGSCSYHTV